MVMNHGIRSGKKANEKGRIKEMEMGVMMLGR